MASWLADDLPILVATKTVAGWSGLPAWRLLGPLRVHRRGRARRLRRRAARGRGVGRRLLEELAAAAEDAGLYKLTSRVFTDNAASRAVHLAAGFEEAGIQRRHGKLDGEWKDCVLVERLLGEAAEPR